MDSKLFVLVPALLVLAGCATSAPQAALPVVQSQLATRADHIVASWPLTADELARSETAVGELLYHDLRPETAVRIALLNNRALRTTFEELGLSQAALAAATRLTNPSFDASVRWPDNAPRGPNVDFGIALPLLEALLLPARRGIAEAQLLAVQYRVSHEVLALVAAVRSATYGTLSQEELHRLGAEIAATTAAAAEFAERQFTAGNISRLDLLRFQVAAQQSQVELAQAEAALFVSREQLSALLGLTMAQSHWKLAGQLPRLPLRDDLPADLESIARAQRLDLAARRAEATLTAEAFAFKQRTRFLPVALDLGVNTERESSGDRLTGPTFAAQLPIFDQGQPERARLASSARQAAELAAALEATIGSEVRTARAMLAAARQAASFQEESFVPLKTAALQETLLHYNAMQVSVYVLLEAKQAEQTALLQSIEARRDYWLARVELERALGQRLPETASVATGVDSLPGPAPLAPPMHAHH